MTKREEVLEFVQQTCALIGQSRQVIAALIPGTSTTGFKAFFVMNSIGYREANARAGYVYVISNIGSFGEGIYKIGMTRRLDPQDRVDELGDASVPFTFGVHAMIFSDDAPALENALHQAFDDLKVNMVNGRKEFFKSFS